MTKRQHSYTSFIEDRLPPAERAEVEGESVVVCDAGPGNPVLFVSDAFEAYTGYPAVEVIGQNLSLLQGPASEASAVEQFRALMRDGQPGQVRITNYRKDGSQFLHECEFRPVRDAAGRITHFIAIQRPIRA